MFKFFSLLIASLFFLGANYANSDLLFYDDCENKWLLQTDWLESNTTKGDNYAALSSDYARAGSRSYKLHVQPFDVNNYGATNSGLILRGINSPVQIKNFLYEKEYWMGFSVLIPGSYNWPDENYILDSGGGEWQLLWQFHGVQDSCDQANLNPNVAGLINKGSYSFSIKGDNRACISRPYVRSSAYAGAISKGVWHDIVINFRFSYNNSGFFKIWLDGKQVANDTGMNCYAQSKGPYFVLGPYGHMRNGATIYYDEIRVGGANSSFSEVSPKGSSAPVTNNPLEPPTLEIVSGN